MDPTKSICLEEKSVFMRVKFSFLPAFLFGRVRGIVGTNLRHSASVTITILRNPLKRAQIVLAFIIWLIEMSNL